VNGVTSSIRRKRLALFRVNFGSRGVLTLRSLCGMQTTGNRVASARVSHRGPTGSAADEPVAGLVRNSGGPDLNCRFQAFSPARGVVVR
jgi:hypothetical protein